MLSSDFLNPANTPVKLVYYGPVQLETGAPVAGAVMIEAQNPSDPCGWTDMTSMFGTIVLNSTGSNADSRTIGLRGTGAGMPYSGLYRVTINSVVSGGGVANQPAYLLHPSVNFGPVATPCPAEVYVFRIWPDCNANQMEDGWELSQIPPISADINSNGIPDGCEILGGETCRCDWNDSDIVSVQDIFDFLASYFAGNGDFNQNGTTSTQDIFDFLTCYFGLPDPCRGG